MIDTSPDIKKQILDNKIKEIDYVLYTHDHADQTSGIFELRPFSWIKGERINVYADKVTLNSLTKRYDYCFVGRKGYTPILKGNIVKKKFFLQKNKNKIYFKSFQVNHGPIKSTANIFNNSAYISDCSSIEKKDLRKLLNLKYLIIDCLRINKHPTHFNLEEAINLSNILKPKKTILTNLHTDLDYSYLKKNLPQNITPAYDGMVIKT